jgi:hypothetical protein
MDDIKLKKNLLNKKIDDLNNHQLLVSNVLNNISSIKIFMEHHVYAVWDFMSILKSLQNQICPSEYPWKPNKYSKNGISRLINEIVLAEESDEITNNKFMSHFDLYIQAMSEVGADTSKINKLINSDLKADSNFSSFDIPKCSKDFVGLTYKMLLMNKLHITAALFTYGRETTLPKMFANILRIIKNVQSTEKLSIYLNRHIDIDSSRHGPLSLKLYEISINNDSKKQHEALDAAILSLDSRMKLWTGILTAIKT